MTHNSLQPSLDLFSNRFSSFLEHIQDVHSRYRSSTSLSSPIARFNERFLLSLGTNPSCLIVDDELNVLPLSAGKNIVPLEGGTTSGAGLARSASKGKRRQMEGEEELLLLKESLSTTKGIGEVLARARTLDQAKAILTFTDAITSKSLSQTVSLTAARGRGKSAALGLSIALAVLHSYSNIFVTSPSPENLKTLFEFVFKGFDALGWEEHLDYDIVQSVNPDWKGAVVRVNIFRQHRQTIQVNLVLLLLFFPDFPSPLPPLLPTLFRHIVLPD